MKVNKRLNLPQGGYVIFKEYLGDDLDPVNVAKVSFDKESQEFGEKEKRLLNFLGREDHTSPFRHSFLTFEVYAPLMVARQFWKYIIGSDHSEQNFFNRDPFTAWNESSRRYISETPEFYVPGANEWRSAPDNRKQGSGQPVSDVVGKQATSALLKQIEQGLKMYDEAIEAGICVEQARLFLPAYGMQVRWRWASSLQGVCHLLEQRLAHDAQKEFQDYAQIIYSLVKEQFPHAVDAYLKRDKK